MTNGGEIIKKIVSCLYLCETVSSLPADPTSSRLSSGVMNGSLCGRLFWHRGDDGV